MMGILRALKGDKVLWVTIVLLSVVSLLMVYGSIGTLAFKYKGGNTIPYLVKHAAILCMGLGIIYLIHRIRFSYFSRIGQIGFYISIPLLIYATFWGVEAGGAGRWIEIPGLGLTFQPSDLAKLSLLMYLARLLTVKQDMLGDFKKGFLPVFLPVVLICGLIFPTNFSTSAMLFATCMLLLFIGKARIKHLLTVAGAGIVFLGVVIMLIIYAPGVIPRGETWKERLTDFTSGNAKENYQSEMAKTAIGSSNFFVGKGLGNSDQRSFLPQASSDFIFAMILEQMGGLLGIVLIFFYIIILFRAIRIATKCEKLFGVLVSVGLAFSLVFQAFINMAVAVNLFPVTGQPLPFISMGGTSIWFTSIAVGILLSVSRELETELPAEKDSVPDVSPA
ncbi:MAG: FtsW/RodA/SpoVE family cell cycle protein [Bacteroidia bacterium]|nr:FtsW/RodA/SpoVE family cell cycle protein [Bacteroidia bacterium]